jgi:hypothetical protein
MLPKNANIRAIKEKLMHCANRYIIFQNNFPFAGQVNPAETTPVTRVGMQGLREPRVVHGLDGDISYIREFYRIELDSAVAFVAIDAVENEIPAFGSGFDLILESNQVT